MKWNFNNYYSAFLLFLLISFHSVAQNPVYKKYTVDDGLPSNVIYQISQDTKGYIWLATDKGASRFDGTRFQNFTIENGLPDNEVLTITEDKQSRIWFKSFTGPMSYYDGTVHNSSNTPWLKQLEFKRFPISFNLVSNGDILICNSASEAFRLNDTTLLKDNSLKGYSIIETNDGSFFQIENDSLLENNRKIEVPNSRLKGKRNTFSWFNKKENILLIANDSGMYCYQRHQLNSIPNSRLIYNINGCVMVSDKEGYFWMTDFSKLYRFKIDSNSNIVDVHKYMDGIAINNIFQDKDNNYWFATKGEGLLMVPSLHIKLFNKASGLDDNNITTAIRINDNTILAGTLNGSVHSINNEDKVINTVNLHSNQIQKIIKGENNKVFILSQNYLFEKQSNEIKKINSFATSYKSILISKNGEVITGGVNIISKHINGKEVVIPVRNISFRIYSMCKNSRNELWLGTEKGLYLLNNETSVPFHPEIKSFTGWIDDISKTNDDKMFVTTRDSGLAIIADNKIDFINTNDGLQSNICSSLFYDSLSGKIYLGLNKGLSVISLNKINNKVEEIKNYNASNGLVCGSIFSVSENNGEILLSTGLGLLAFYEKDLNTTIESPKVYITQMEINNVKVDLKPDYNLTHNENNIRIVFDGISFRDAKSLEYRYQLTPADTGWNSTFSNAVVYPDLLPGSYKFNVQVRIGDGKWLNENSSLNFTINKPYWAEWWFRIIILLIITFIIYTIYRYQLRKKLEQQMAISADRARISSEMHDDLGSGLSKISLLSELINQNTAGGEMKPHLENISRSSKEMVEAMGDIIWSMNVKNDDLSNLIAYTRKYAVEFFETTSVRCFVVLPGIVPLITIDGKTRRNVFLVVKESLHNVLKHSGAKQVKIEFIISPHSFSITIADNGKGIDSSKLSEFGNGLLNMEKRMVDTGGTFSIKNKEGTIIEIIIPIKYHQ